VLDLLASGIGALLLFISARQLLGHPGVGSAMLGGTVPITNHKWPWLAVIAALLLLFWLGVRAIGGRRGGFWGARLWLLRVGFWWSLAALFLFVGVAGYGFATRSIADLNWLFALGYLVLVVPVVLGFWFGWRYTARGPLQ
jgi:hypothetical protein